MQTLTYRNEIARINAALAFNPALTCLALADDVNAMVGARQIEDGWMRSSTASWAPARACLAKNGWPWPAIRGRSTRSWKRSSAIP